MKPETLLIFDVMFPQKDKNTTTQKDVEDNKRQKAKKRVLYCDVRAVLHTCDVCKLARSILKYTGQKVSEKVISTRLPKGPNKTSEMEEQFFG